jgi:hypothetical protein
MTALPLNIRGLCWAVLFLVLLDLGRGAQAGAIVVDEWEDLIPANLYDFVPDGGITSALWLDEAFQKKLKDSERRTRPELERAETVLPGYMVPLDYRGDLVFQFLLVPSAGQCIHVPPPPPNQTVLVTSENGVKIRTYADPLIVRGLMRVEAGLTDYAETGYTLEATEVLDFDFDLMDKLVEDLSQH